MIFYCPGSKPFKQPYPEDVSCPSCKEGLEIWTDEVEVVCPKCKSSITRPGKPSCLDWCKFARECVGEEKYSKYIKSKSAVSNKTENKI